MLSQNTSKTRFGVIENEFGAINIDASLVKDKIETSEATLIELSNGCVCCTIRGDVAVAIGQLLDQGNIEHIIVESTGLADPSPIASVLFMDVAIQERAQIASIVCVVDALHCMQHWEDVDVFQKQIAFSDTVLMNKVDLVDARQVETLVKKINSINSEAKVLECVNCEVSFEDIIQASSVFDLDKVRIDDVKEKDKTKHGHGHSHGHSHGQSEISTFSITQPGTLHMDRLSAFMNTLVTEMGEQLYRYKGVLSVQGVDDKFVFQGVHMHVDSAPTSAWGTSPGLTSSCLLGGN